MKSLYKVKQCWKMIFAYTFAIVFCLSCLTGCGPTLSNPEQVNVFKKAGPVASEADIETSDTTPTQIGPYRVLPGDLLKLQIPSIVQIISTDVSGLVQADLHEGIRSYLCRVSDAGTIILPIIGEVPVGGKTVAEIESSLIDAYYPKYVVNYPMVVCGVAEYQRENERVFTVMGLVNRPYTFPYPPDVQYNLSEALAFAGGLNMIADPRYVKIYRPDATGEIASAIFGIGSKRFADACNVPIKPGDVVYVDQTMRTRMNQFLAGVFHVGVGAEYSAYDYRYNSR